MTKSKLTLTIEKSIIEKAKKTLPSVSAFVQDMLERELAGEFNQLKIDGLKKEINLLESQTVQIQTKQQEQKKRSNDNYNKIIADQLREREAFRRQRKKPPKEER